MEAIYLDTCLPDYFQGFGGDVICTPVDGESTNQDVLDGLLSDLQSGPRWDNDANTDWSDAQWDAAEQSIREMFADVKDMTALFDSSLEESDDDMGEMVYVYVGLK
jgi:hypothetical protein